MPYPKSSSHPKIALTIAYILTLIVTLSAAMASYYTVHKIGYGIEPKSPTAINIYRIILIFIIITIPLTLKGFNMGLKRVRAIEDETIRNNRYKQLGVARIIIIGIGLIASVIGFYFLQEQSLIWLAGISAIALIICKPNEKKIDNDLAPEVIEDAKESEL